jgi:GNAT superfamily N-acetyltransferase
VEERPVGATMTTAATREDYPQIADYLERQGEVRTAWVKREVWWALRRDDPGGWWVVVHRRAGEVAGVTTLRPHGGEGRCRASMAADDEEDVLALLNSLPDGTLFCINTHSPRVQAALDHLPQVTRYPGGPLMTVTAGCFRPVLAEGIREVTSQDAGLFDGLDQPPWDCEGEKGGRHFALIRESEARSRASWIPLMLEPVFSPPIIRITYVATAEAYRRQGLGKQVLSYVTDLVLRAPARPMYWTSVGNFPSQELAKSLGYEEVGRHAYYEWRRP